MTKVDREDMRLLERPDEELEFADFLRKRWLQFFVNNGGYVSQNDFAKKLKISNANLTNYMTNLRKPSAEFAVILADALGPIVYDKLDLPRRMPRDKTLLFVVDSFAEFSEEERKEIIEHIKNMREKRERRRGPGEVLA